MNNIQFYNSFYFFECNFKRSHHTDNSRGTKCHHIGYIKSGEAEFHAGDKIYKFSSGDVFYTPTGCKYHSYWAGDCICYDSYAFSLFPLSSGEEFDIQKLNMTKKAWDALHALSANKSLGCASVAMLYTLLSEVIPAMTPKEKDAQSAALSRALAFLREDISLDVPKLAKKMGMSLSALYALFKDKLDSTPITEKNRIRTEMAKELLINTDLSVEEISAKLGFSTAAYFRKILHTFYGKTPRQIRKEQHF